MSVNHVKSLAMSVTRSGDTYTASFTCPGSGETPCGASGTATGEDLAGPFTGRCQNGHFIHVMNHR